MKVNMIFFERLKAKRFFSSSASQRAICATENRCRVQFCIIVLVIIEYGVGIGSRTTVNVNIKCDVKNESESMS
jgi:hypothetical protein